MTDSRETFEFTNDGDLTQFTEVLEEDYHETKYK